MRRFMAFIVPSIYFFSNVEFYELLKMPLFVEHYQEYVANGEGDLLDFLVHHYGGHEQDSDWDTDMKLPFMSLSSDVHSAFYLTKIKLELPDRPVLATAFKQPLSKLSFLTPSYFFSILQPPRWN